METNNEANAVTSTAPDPNDRGRAALDAEIARMQAEEEPVAPTETAFSESLASEGIGVEVKPKPPETAPATEPAVAAAEPEGYGDDGLAALVEADSPRGNRDELMARRSELQTRAETLGLAPSIAKAIAANAKPEEAEKYLDSLASGVQSSAAGQTVESSAPPAGPAALPLVPSEVLSSIRDGSGEATAKAVEHLMQGFEARVQHVEALAQQSAEATHADRARGEWMGAAGELAERFPLLVRGQTVDSAVAQVAAALHMNGPFAGDKRASLEAAARLTYAGNESVDRQSTTATTEPTTPSPAGAPGAPTTKPISGAAAMERFAAIERKYASNPMKRDTEMARAVAAVRAQNGAPR